MAYKYWSTKSRISFNVPIIRKEQDVEGRTIERLGGFDAIAKDLVYANMREYEKSGQARIDYETKVHTVRYFWFPFDLEALKNNSYELLNNELAQKAKSFFIHKAAKPKVHNGMIHKSGSPDPDDTKSYLQTEMDGILIEEVPNGTPGSYNPDEIPVPGEEKKLLPPIEIEPLVVRQAKTKEAKKAAKTK